MLTAVIDESSPQRPDGTVVYVLAAVILDTDECATISTELQALFPRRRPFHWEADKGPVVRDRMVDFIIDKQLRLYVAGATVTAPKRQNQTREALLQRRLLFATSELEVHRLCIETRSTAEVNQDLRSIRNWYREHRLRCPALGFADKSDPMTWLADAASGIWADALLGRDRHLLRLIAAGCMAHASTELP